MNSFYTHILAAILFSMIVLIITAILFYKRGYTNLIILIFILLSCLIAIELAYTFSWLRIEVPIATIINTLLIIVPILYCYLLRKQFRFSFDRKLITVFSISTVCFITCLVLPSYSVYSIALDHFCIYIFVALSVKTEVSLPFSLFFIVSHIMFALLQSVTVLTEIHFVSSLVITGVMMIIFAESSLVYKKKLSHILEQYTAITEQSKKMIHTIARLRLSNEQCRKIIVEKDLELFQLGRHASLAELTAGIAHELAQPLTGIKLLSQNMIDDMNCEEFNKLQAVSELLKICSLVDKSTKIIEHIRNFSKKTPSTMKIIDLNKVFLNAVDLIQLQLKKNDIDLVFVLDETIPKINGDKIALEQLFINIILNAKDAIKKKQENKLNYNGSIHITTTRTDSNVKVIIEDNGIGIPDTMIQKIWSPFYTTKKRDHGTGIGLSISNKIVKDHNGTVEVTSSQSGTVFTFLFPIPEMKPENSIAQ